MDSALYSGTLRHRRFRPVAHEFRYELFMAFLDIERIPEVMGRSLFSSYNRFNWAAFHERDHFGEASLPLRERLAIDAAAHGITLPGGAIFLLTNLCYLGYTFNPISLFYCLDEAGQVGAVLAEVNSTFGERRNYWLSGGGGMRAGGPLRDQCAKEMHVSPFMPMDLGYNFTLTRPGASLVAHMETVDGREEKDGPLFDATLTLERREWTAAELQRQLARHPWMTAKVIAGIHWEALRLYWKGAPVYTHPAKIGQA